MHEKVQLLLPPRLLEPFLSTSESSDVTLLLLWSFAGSLFFEEILEFEAVVFGWGMGGGRLVGELPLWFRGRLVYIVAPLGLLPCSE